MTGLTTRPEDDGGRAIGLDDPARFLNREIQWLEFNDRVLQQAVDDRVPLLERVRFLAIFSSNLDEFIMKRVGGLRRQFDAGVSRTYDGMTPAEQLNAIRDRMIPMITAHGACYRDQIVPALQAHGIHLLHYSDMTSSERNTARAWYREQIYPICTPLAVDPGHRFPFISNLSLSIAVKLRRPGTTEHLFARVKAPTSTAAWFGLGEGRYVPMSEVLTANIADLFPGMEILNVLPFRVTRNADIENDFEDADDLLVYIEQQLRERRFAPVVRLEVSPNPDPDLMAFLIEELELDEDDIYETESPAPTLDFDPGRGSVPTLLTYESLFQIADLDRPELKYRPWNPITPHRFQDDEKDIFSVIREGDALLHHPYDSFDSTVVRFIHDAARDPNVLCIKQALYRTSGDSPFVSDLIQAAEAGKQVAVLVELRARFDEERNIQWARKLEDAGVHVAYGVVGLKTHTKIALVVRQEAAGIRCYGHVATGNYNAKTARLYEDVGLLTCDPEMTSDVIALFNYLTGRSLQQDYHKLLVAPVAMKQRFIELIEEEIEHHRAGRPAGVIAKMNQLQDHEVIDALYRASEAGVPVDLLIRGFCTLRPRTPGLSENIRVSSIIGRFLEHSRIFYFRRGEDDPVEGLFSFGSADWMYRNLHARVEAVCPVEDRELRERLWDILMVYRDDRIQAWDMTPDGAYVLRPAGDGGGPPAARLGSHEALMQMAEAAAHGREQSG